MFAAILPALLLYVLLFMETSICQLIMLDKTKGVKGVGVHLDIVLLGGLNTLTGIIRDGGEIYLFITLVSIVL